MTKAEYEAQKLTDNTKIEWRPVCAAGAENLYLISAEGKVYNIERHTVIAIRKYKKCSTEYVALNLNGRKLFQVAELLLKTFPELYPDSSSDDWKVIELNNEKSAYEVSRHGKIRRINNHRELKPDQRFDGYAVIRLRHHKKTITEYVHRIVAQTFLPNPNGYEMVNHIDENRQNNDVNNLEWCDRRYNYYYNGANKRAHFHSVLTQKLQKLSKIGNDLATDILKTPEYYKNAELLETAVKLVAE